MIIQRRFSIQKRGQSIFPVSLGHVDLSGQTKKQNGRIMSEIAENATIKYLFNNKGSVIRNY